MLARSGGSSQSLLDPDRSEASRSSCAAPEDSCQAIANFLFERLESNHGTPIGFYADPNEQPRDASARNTRFKKLSASIAEAIGEKGSTAGTGQSSSEAAHDDPGAGPRQADANHRKAKRGHRRPEKGTQSTIKLLACESRSAPKDLPLFRSEGSEQRGAAGGAGTIPVREPAKRPRGAPATITDLWRRAGLFDSSLDDYSCPDSSGSRGEPGATAI